MKTFIKNLLPLILLAFCTQAYATTHTWKGTTSTDWNVASNWSPASVPTGSDAVQIGFSTFTNQPAISSSETCSVASLSFGSSKTATLTLNGLLSVNGDISMASATTISISNTGVLCMNGNTSSGTIKSPSSSSTSKIILNSPSAQYFPNTTKLSGNIGYLDVKNDYFGSDSDKGVTLLNNTSGSVTINYLYVEDNAIFNANATLVEGTNYHCTIGANAIYISRSTFNFHSNDEIDPSSTLEFTAANQVINLYKTNAAGTNIPPNVLFTGSNITVNAGTSPNNVTVFKVLGTLGVQNTTNSVTFDSQLTLIDVDGDFTGNGALSSGSLPINIGGSWLNTASYDVGGKVTYDGNSAGSTQLVATSVNYQKDVVFTGASTKQVASGTLTIGGNLDNSAGTKADFITNSSTVNMDGSGTQYIKGGSAVNSTYPSNIVNGTVFNNINVSPTGANAKVILQGNNSISPLGVIAITTSPASLDATASNSLTLLSDASGSAALGAIPAGSSVSGIVNVQRFVKGSYPADLSRRGYRLVSSPVYTGTVSGTKVFDLTYLANGAIITGPAGGGFYSVGNPSAYIYREDILPSNTNFTTGNYKGIAAINNSPAYNIGTQKRLTLTNVADTTVNLPAGNGVLFFFRGNKVISNGSTGGTKTSLPYNYPEDVTFTDVGTFNTGTINVKLWFKSDNYLSYTNSPSLANSASRGYCLVGNPYASAINWEKYNRNGTNSSIYGGGGLSSVIYMFNPTNKQYEAYMQKSGAVTMADTTTNLDPGTAVGSASNMIASGQGFFVRASTATQTLSFRETAKTTAQPSATKLNMLMGKPKQTTSTGEPLIRLQMAIDDSNTDEIVIRPADNASSAFVVNEDAEDMGGSSPQVSLSSLSSDGIKLAINRVPLPSKKAAQVVPLYLDAVGTSLYQLKLTQATNLPANNTIYLRDSFKHDSVNMSENPVYAFTIDKTDSTTFGKRFSLVLIQEPASQLKLVKFNADKANGGALVSWKVKHEARNTTFYIERSVEKNSTFASIGSEQSNNSGNYTFIDKYPLSGKNQYRLKMLDAANNVTYSDVVTLTYTSVADNINKLSIFPNPSANVINLTMKDADQKKAYNIKIMSSMGLIVKEILAQQSNWKVNVGNLRPGSYIVQVVNNKDNSLVGIGSFIKD